eukprot:10606009-Alexandrium_andersonii.AAC.1
MYIRVSVCLHVNVPLAVVQRQCPHLFQCPSQYLSRPLPPSPCARMVWKLADRAFSMRSAAASGVSDHRDGPRSRRRAEPGGRHDEGREPG